MTLVASNSSCVFMTLWVKHYIHVFICQTVLNMVGQKGHNCAAVRRSRHQIRHTTTFMFAEGVKTVNIFEIKYIDIEINYFTT